MYKGIKKLARLIRLMAVDVAKEDSWWKLESIGPAIGLPETDDFFDEITVEDDSGYRAIIIGDTRGNVSRVNGRKIGQDEQKGYMLLYTENASYENGKRKWEYRCFPNAEIIAKRLQKVVDKIRLSPDADGSFFWYYESGDSYLNYLSGVVKEYADAIEADSRTADEIFANCMKQS